MTIKANLRARRRRRRIMVVSVVAILVAILVVVYIAASMNKPNELAAYIGKPVPSAVLQDLTGVSDGTLAAIGTPSGVSPPTSISGASFTSDGKPVFLYMGAEYCPYCAVERWAIIVALSHFGTFHGLELMISGDSPEVNPDTPTFTFVNATYSSSYISFQSVEENDRAHNALQSPTAEQSSLFSQYDTCSTNGEVGGIPFIDIANQYVTNCGSQFQLGNTPTSPSPYIVGMNWTQIASQLNNPNSAIAQRIDGAANTLISAICKVTGGSPSSVCAQSYASQALAPISGSLAVTEPLIAVPSRAADQLWID